MANVNLGIQVLWTGNNVVANLEGVERGLDDIYRAVDRISIRMEEMGRRTERATRRAESGMQRFGRGLAGIVRAARLAQIAIAGIILGGIGRFLGSIVNAAAEYRVLINMLTFTEGTAAGARAALVDLGDALLDMGANIEAGVNLYARLRLQGVEGARDIALAVSGLSATMGLSTTQISRVTLAISQMFSKGTFVRAEEFNQQLRETLTIAAPAAAEGFRMMGNAALDTTDEINRAVAAGTLRVRDFIDALVQGSVAYINQASNILNLRTQWDGFVQIIRLMIGAQGELSGQTQAFAIILNAVNHVMLGWINNFRDLDLDEKTDQVWGIIQATLSFIEGIEVMARQIYGLSNIFIGFFRLLFDGFTETNRKTGLFRALIDITNPIAGAMRAVQSLFRQFGQGVDETNRFASGWNQIRYGMQLMADYSHPIADAIRTEIGGRERVRQLIEESSRAAHQLADASSEASDTANAGAARLATRYEGLIEDLEHLNEQFQNMGDRAMDPITEAIAKARQPFIEMEHRYANLLTQFEQLRLRGQPVGDAIEQITLRIQQLGEAEDVAAARAERLARAQQAIEDIRSRGEVTGIQRQAQDLIERVVVRFESEGQEQVRNAERELMRTREDVAQRIEELNAQLRVATEEQDVAEQARLQARIAAEQEYGGVLAGVTGVMLVNAERLRQLVDSVRGTVQGSITDLIGGLVGAVDNFDFGDWARNMINRITMAIAESWSQKITDRIFDLLGMGRQQEVRTMNVQKMNVMGGGGQGGGGWMSELGGLFGGGKGGGKGGGDWMSTAMSFIGGFFANGGVRGLMSGPLAGSITPFANGGVTGGPTLFGLAGEKGKEGILPLERIGGKLGVNAMMGGGMQATININAIDTQTGAMFIRRHAPAIIGELYSNQRLGTFRTPR